MASYRGHLAFGGAAAAAGVAGVAATTTIADMETLAIVFLLVLAGAFLPDVDSDTSLPFYFVYGAFTLGVTTLITYRTLLVTDDLTTRIAAPLAAFAVVWFIVGRIVKSLTHHRGMFHSIPVLGIWMLGTVLLAHVLQFTEVQAILFGLAVGVGYFSHLLLDEIYSVVDFRGLPFIPNKAFGSALKFWSSSHAASIACYAALIVLAYLSAPTIAASVSLVASYLSQL